MQNNSGLKDFSCLPKTNPMTQPPRTRTKAAWFILFELVQDGINIFENWPSNTQSHLSILQSKSKYLFYSSWSGHFQSFDSSILHMGKNLKKWKMWKTYILWYLCQNSFKCEFNTPHIVKVDSGLVLFSSFFPFQLTLRLKKSFCVFWQFCRKKVV